MSFFKTKIEKNVALCISKIWKQTTLQNRYPKFLMQWQRTKFDNFFPHVSAKTNLEGDISQRQIYLEQNIQTAQRFVMQLQQIENARFYLIQLKLKANKASVMSSSRQVIVSQSIIFVLHRQREDRKFLFIKNPIYFKVISWTNITNLHCGGLAVVETHE